MSSGKNTVNLLWASDLHLDVGRLAGFDLAGHIAQLEDSGSRIDAVILGGDLMEAGSGGGPVAYAAAQVPSHIAAAFIPGNHDFYGGRYGVLANRWRAQAKGSHVHVLMEDSMEVSSPDGGRIVLLGTTLWSNLKSMGPVVEAQLRKKLQYSIADFSCMYASNGKPWTVADMLVEFEKGYEFLKKELSGEALADGRRRVVATHFGPHESSIALQWRNDDITAYFINHLPELVEKADLWLHGHTHTRVEYQVGNDPTRGKLICEPRGYAGGQELHQALAYVPRYIQVPVQRVAWD